MNEKELKKKMFLSGQYTIIGRITSMIKSIIRPDKSYEIAGAEDKFLDMRGLNIDKNNIFGWHLRWVDLSRASLKGLWIENCVFENVCFDNTDLSGIADHGNIFKNCSFIGTRFVEASIGYKGTSYDNCNFEGADFYRAVFIRAEYDKCSFRNCKLKGVDFNASSFVNCEFAGKLEDVWFRGGFPLEELEHDFGVPRKNTMANVSFEKASLFWVTFSNQCDLSSIIIPSEGCYRLYSDWKQRLESLKKAAGSWSQEEQSEVNIFTNAELVHAQAQNFFLLNCEEIIKDYGNILAHKIIETLDRYDFHR